MTLNYIWWSDSAPGDLDSMEKLFIAIITRSTLTRSGSIF